MIASVAAVFASSSRDEFDAAASVCCVVVVLLVAVPWAVLSTRENNRKAEALTRASANPNAARLRPQLEGAVARAGERLDQPLVTADELSSAIASDDVLEAIRCSVNGGPDVWVWILTGRIICSPTTPPDHALIWPHLITDIQRQGYRLLVTMRSQDRTVALGFGADVTTTSGASTVTSTKVAALDNLARAERLIRGVARW